MNIHQSSSINSSDGSVLILVSTLQVILTDAVRRVFSRLVGLLAAELDTAHNTPHDDENVDRENRTIYQDPNILEDIIDFENITASTDSSSKSTSSTRSMRYYKNSLTSLLAMLL